MDLKRLCAQTFVRHGIEADPSGFSGHSMRRGGAQMLRDRGVPRDLVMSHGRWRSSAVDVYFKGVCDITRAAVARVFSSSGLAYGWSFKKLARKRR